MSDRPARPVAALGEFDGFHLGHRHLVERARLLAEHDGLPVVAVVIDDLGHSESLMTIDERCRAALLAGCAAVRVVAIDTTGGATAGAGIAQDVAQMIDPSAVVMARVPRSGPGSRFPSLRDDVAAAGLRLVEVDRWTDPAGCPVTSDRLRSGLRMGHVADVSLWLGAAYELSGEVVHGSGLGRTIGFPTANLDPPQGRVIPARGVYAARAILPNGTTWPAAVNIGVRPTVANDGRVLVEAHLIGFDGDLYGATLRLAFQHWLRAEQQFASVDALVAQLQSDMARVTIAVR